MSSRVLWFAVSRARVWLPALVGVGLIAGGRFELLGVLLLAAAAYALKRTLSYDDLEDRLRLRAEKKQHGIRRLLKESERREIIAIDAYCQQLSELGADPILPRDVMDQAWAIVRDTKAGDAAAALQRLRQGLPTLDMNTTTAPTGRPVHERIQEELNIIRAAYKEVELVGEVPPRRPTDASCEKD